MAGARREWLGSNDFVMIHLDLIDLGLSWEAAGLLHRIHFRSGGEGWWYATKEEMQADVRLTEWKLRRAVEELRTAGLIEWQRQSATNPTLMWRVVFGDGEVPAIPHSRDGGNLTQETEETSVTSTKNGKNKDSSSPDGDGGSGDRPKASAPGVDALFSDWWTYYPKKVSKKDAKSAFEKALKRATFEVIRAGLVASIKTWRLEGRVVVEGAAETLTVKLAAGTPEARELAKGVPHAATWLNADRWEDEHDAAPAAATNEGGQSWMHRTPENTI